MHQYITQVAVGQVHHTHLYVLGQHIDLPGNGNGSDIQKEKSIPAGKPAFGKPVGGKTTGEYLYQGYDDGQLERVKDEPQEIYFLPDYYVVVPYGIFGNPLYGYRKHVCIVFEGRRKHPDKRQKGNNDDRQKQEVKADTDKRISLFNHFCPLPSLTISFPPGTGRK
jgi:hypothetical protein